MSTTEVPRTSASGARRVAPVPAGETLPGQVGGRCPTAVWLAPAQCGTGQDSVAEDAASVVSAASAREAASSLAKRLNWLRAGVLGANDGVVSVAGLVVGVAAAAPTNTTAIMTSGAAGILAGAVSMAAGEYVSVSTQSDTERALVERQRFELAADPEAGVDELTSHYRSKGLSAAAARWVALELTAHDAVGAHLDAELGLREDDYTNPWHAAISSAVAFTVGSVLPLLAILLLPVSVQIPLTFVAVLMGLALTGGVSARLGDAPVRPAILRNMIGGALAMVVTWGIGCLIGVTV